MYEKIFDLFPKQLTEEEKALLKDSRSGTTSQINQTQVTAQLYLIKTLENNVDKMIKSNEILSNSNDKRAKSMNLLTGALVFIGIAQVMVQILNN